MRAHVPGITLSRWFYDKGWISWSPEPADCKIESTDYFKITCILSFEEAVREIRRNPEDRSLIECLWLWRLSRLR